MMITRSLSITILAASLCLALPALAQDIIFIAPTNHTMPLAQFENGTLSGGILKDLGELIAQRMGLHAVFVSIPSRRVSDALSSGTGDAVCYVLPRWLDGNFNWTQPVLNNAGLVVARSDAPVIKSLADLADKPVGTIAGYRYPDIEAVLGKQFRRDDAPTMDHNFRKLAVGRMQYAVMEQSTYSYHMRTQPDTKVRADLVFASFKTQCAFSLKSRVPFEQAERAIGTLIDDGSVQALQARYR